MSEKLEVVLLLCRMVQYEHNEGKILQGHWRENLSPAKYTFEPSRAFAASFSTANNRHCLANNAL